MLTSLEKAGRYPTNDQWKQIDKEFAQVNVLVDTGKVITGIRISEDEKGIVLRNVAEPKPITIPDASIEDVIESKTSMMPEGLLRNLSDTEVIDLVAYLRTPGQVALPDSSR